MLVQINDELFASLKSAWEEDNRHVSLQACAYHCHHHHLTQKEHLYEFLERRYLLPQVATVVANEVFLGSIL